MLVSQNLRQMTRLKVEFEESFLRVGGIAALLAGLLFRRNLGAELTLLNESGLITGGRTTPPTTVSDWFTLLQHEPLVGLTWLNIFDLVNYALLAMMFVALWIALRRMRRSGMGLATVLGLIGIGIYFVSNQAFALLSLSEQYAAATSAAQRSLLLAHGQMLLTLNEFSSQGRSLSLMLIAIASLLTSIIMLRNHVFSRAIAVIGMLASGLDLAYCFALALVPTVGSEVLAVCLIPAAGLFWMLWHVLIGHRLCRQGCLTPKMP